MAGKVNRQKRNGSRVSKKVVRTITKNREGTAESSRDGPKVRASPYRKAFGWNEQVRQSGKDSELDIDITINSIKVGKHKEN